MAYTFICLISIDACVSGERESLWLCEAEGDADLCKHGGPERADTHSPLWAVQTLQTGGDGIQRHRPRVQTRQVSCQLLWRHNKKCITDMSDAWPVYILCVLCVCAACSRLMRPSVRSSWWSCRRERTRWGRCLCRGWRRKRLSWRKLRGRYVVTQMNKQTNSPTWWSSPSLAEYVDY